MTALTIESILWNWRKQICFADAVKLEDGRYGTVVGAGAVAPIMLDIVIGHPSKASEGRATVHRDTLFPAWWPLDQFRKSTEKE